MIMNNDQPIAFFITFTVYGTFLQGDARWWRSRTNGTQPPQWAVFIDRPVCERSSGSDGAQVIKDPKLVPMGNQPMGVAHRGVITGEGEKKIS